MAKAGVSTEIISLPKGGGALHGIGETFSPDLFTGTGNFSVPIVLPPGRNGFQPALDLVYSTGNGNSPFGLGWSLSIPGVSRKTSKGVPRYRDAEDVFILSGAEDLIPVSGGFPGKIQYRPRTEGLFARIMYQRDSNNSYWEVRSKDGLVSFYGMPEALGTDPAVVADPANRTKVFAWKLTRTLDTFGNKIEYEYLSDSGENGPHRWDQLYLKRIRYADYNDESTSEERFLVSVTFDYGDPDEERPDPFSEYRAGFEIRTRKRCRRIIIRTHAGEERLVRTYRLIYLDERVAAGDLPETVLPHNGVSLLSQIRVLGHDNERSVEADRTQELPPLEFGYTRFEPMGRNFFPLEGKDLPAQSLASPDLELAELFGNGLSDIFQMNGNVRYWRNLGNGAFDRPREMREAPAGLRLADPGVQLIDANGDGHIDLLVTSEPLAGYFPTRPGGLWDRRSFQRYRQVPSFNLEDPEVQLVDLDGDGVTDAIRSGSRLECFFNDPLEGWNGTRFVERQDIEDFPNVNFSDPRVKWADMSGDNLQDIVLVYDGNVEYWPNRGHGDWGKRVSMRNSPRFPYGYDPRRILLGDVDGDGLADLIYVDHRKVILWINQGGNRWSDPIEIDGTPPVTDMDAVRLVDLLGTGMGGVLWSAEATASGRPHLFFLDFTGGVKPYLMHEMNNHMGALTRVEYAPSTRFYLKDQQRPETRWQSTLPFPVQVVARVEVIDELSRGKLTTEYQYHHGYWNGAEREFRGFGRVDQRDTEVFKDYHASGLHSERPFEAVSTQSFSPPTETRIWFHQGPVGEEFGEWAEADYSGEYFPDDPQRLERPGDFATFLEDAAIPRRVKRDAVRALRGSILRTELYALDGGDRQERPYTVTESLYSVREEEIPADPGETGRQRIFFPHPLAQRVTQWERGDDPLTQFSFTDDYDEFGQPRLQTSIACPRGWRGVEDVPARPYLATLSQTVFAKPVTTEVYIMDRVAKTTTFEIVNDGNQRVLELKDVTDDDPALKVFGQTLNYYDCEAFIGCSLGDVGDHGAVVRSERLVLTEAILQEAYQSGQTLIDPPELPTYLIPGDTPVATAEYPQEFLDLLPALAGYVFYPGDAEHARGYFVATVRHQYDFQDAPSGAGRGLLRATQDPFGRTTTIGYDAFELLPTQVTDPVGLATIAHYDYRVLQPREVIDPNGNRGAFNFTPLGLLKESFVCGKEATEGDNERPSTRFEYDFLAFVNTPPDRRQPIFVRTIRHEHHDTETDVDPAERDATITTIEYSDGFGRLLQTRTQAEEVIFGDPIFGGVELTGDAVGRRRALNDPPNVVVSGWQFYDNKGRVVEKFEPFYHQGFDYVSPQGDQFGQKVAMFYDPRGQVIRTLNPDGSERRMVYGVPGTIATPDLSNPELFEPTPWEAYTYDENDNAGRTPGSDGPVDPTHFDTPASIEIDALGRTIKSVVRNGPDPASDWFTTRSTYDIRGNLLTVTDALGRKAFRYQYDLADNPLRSENIDAGLRRIVLNAAGNEIERRDSKGALILQACGPLQRPIRLWARDDLTGTLTLRERLVYGDGSDPAQDPDERAANRAQNRLGVLHRHYDEAGLLTIERYDFKGNVLEKTRQVIRDKEILSVFDAAPPDWQVQAYRVDWQPPAGRDLAEHATTLLEAAGYQISMTYDALNRIKTMRYPQDADGGRKELRPQYNRAGALERVELEGTAYVEHIAYNAKGQRSLMALGNGVMTRYDYDPQTFRLARLRSERYTTPDPDAPTYKPIGAPLQNFAYEYDLVGNILTIHDRTPESGVGGTDALDRRFTYDPLYRLLSATGREHDRELPFPVPPWLDELAPAPQDQTKTRFYKQDYRYDKVGNLEELGHNRGQLGAFVRRFDVGPENNRLNTLTVDGNEFSYRFDDNGNLIHETTSRHFEWDHSDQMKAFRTQVGTSGPSVHAHYLYDASGQRVKKLVRKQGGSFETTVYVDGLFEHHRSQRNGEERVENNWLQVMDNQQRVAMVRVGGPHPDDQGPAVQYHLGDHLGSSNLVVDEDGGFVNREEYFPYGETSFGSFAKKRYRFTGKERDEESGLYYHGARYYAPWLARWVSCDPVRVENAVNLYEFVRGNPLVLIDLNGEQPNEIEDILEFQRNQAGFETGAKKPPTFNAKSASPFGTAAHAAATTVLKPMQAIWPEARRIVPEPVIVNGKIVSVGKGPAGAPKGALVPDILVLKKGVDPGNIVGRSATDVGESIWDFKYGGGTAAKKYGKLGLPVNTSKQQQLRPSGPSSNRSSLSGGSSAMKQQPVPEPQGAKIGTGSAGATSGGGNLVGRVGRLTGGVMGGSGIALDILFGELPSPPELGLGTPIRPSWVEANPAINSLLPTFYDYQVMVPIGGAMAPLRPESVWLIYPEGHRDAGKRVPASRISVKMQ